MYQRILVANRGEIALRIIRACRELGVETVAIYSEGDRGARYLELANEAFCVGPAKAADSYLKIASVISAAEVGNVQAIHPGYGFLAENAHFNEICRSCKIDFIGPSPEAMAQLGDKNAARDLARKADVPVVPGSDGIIRNDEEAVRFAHDVGFPVLIKAVAGGGGRGMRVASNDLSLKSALQQARAEAEAAFGNGDVYLEKYIEHPRHVEVQVLADHHGNAVHLWERDCSVQRRHQKLIEESPSTSITPETRTAMCDAARRLILAARLHERRHGRIHRRQGRQVLLHRSQRPHPGRASGHRNGHRHRPDQVADSHRRRRAVCPGRKTKSSTAAPRSSAGSTPKIRKRNFQPSPGKIEQLIAPGGFGVRFDSHAHSGYVVPPYYDSMIGKLIVHQATRAEAIACMQRALAEFASKASRPRSRSTRKS